MNITRRQSAEQLIDSIIGGYTSLQMCLVCSGTSFLFEYSNHLTHSNKYRQIRKECAQCHY